MLAILCIFGIFEITSIFIAGVMCISGAIEEVVPNYYEGDKSLGLWTMVILGGWIFAPYFIYLAIKYFDKKL